MQVEDSLFVSFVSGAVQRSEPVAPGRPHAPGAYHIEMVSAH